MTSYYNGNYNLSDNSKTEFYIGDDEDEDKENISKPTFIYTEYYKYVKNESISSGTQTFIYLNRKEIATSINKNPLYFKHLINNSLINKYFS